MQICTLPLEVLQATSALLNPVRRRMACTVLSWSESGLRPDGAVCHFHFPCCSRELLLILPLLKKSIGSKLKKDILYCVLHKGPTFSLLSCGDFYAQRWNPGRGPLPLSGSPLQPRYSSRFLNATLGWGTRSFCVSAPPAGRDVAASVCPQLWDVCPARPQAVLSDGGSVAEL